MGRTIWIGVILAAAAVEGAAEVTYARDISHIIQAKCQQCHRPNDIAPFTLSTYQEAVDWKDDIARVVAQGKMPPWKPVAGFGEFRNNYSLTAEEKDQIKEWVANSAPLGDEADLPAPAGDQGDWVLGEPDLVLEMPEAFEPPRAKDMYRCFVLPTGFEADKFVSAIDIVPGERRYVHHVILYLDTSGTAEKLDEAEEGPGYTCFGGPGTPAVAGADLSSLLTNSFGLGGWAPGARPQHLPDGIGMQLPPKARIVMQVHYYARGSTAPDKTKAGLYFREKVDRRMIYVPILPLDSRGRVAMEIPAGAAEHEIKAEFLVPPLLDAKVVQVFPHMHLLGKKIKAELVLPARTEATPLIYIDDWDFNWQGSYNLVEQVAAPSFTRIRLSCTYDNTENNPRNPSNPIKTIRWGEGTEDEMCLVFLGVTFDRERLQ